jgi:hypothetical protein
LTVGLFLYSGVGWKTTHREGHVQQGPQGRAGSHEGVEVTVNLQRNMDFLNKEVVWKTASNYYSHRTYYSGISYFNDAEQVFI